MSRKSARKCKEIQKIRKEIHVAVSVSAVSLTSNLESSEWGSFLKNPQLTAALIDRRTSSSVVSRHCAERRTAAHAPTDFFLARLSDIRPRPTGAASRATLF
jgi:hypothetical protein